MAQSKLGKKILHYVGKAIHHFNLLQKDDRLLVCLSGGKDSWAMVWALEEIRKKSYPSFKIRVLTLDQGQPGFDASLLKARLLSLIHI